jgi:hypothetical protein
MVIGKFQFPTHGRNDFFEAKHGGIFAADFSPTSVVRFPRIRGAFLEP